MLYDVIIPVYVSIPVEATDPDAAKDAAEKLIDKHLADGNFAVDSDWVVHDEHGNDV